MTITLETRVLGDELRGWLGSTARALLTKRQNRRISAEDLAQEGWIAMWRVLDKVDSCRGDGMGLLKVAARRRMIDVLRSEYVYTKSGRSTPRDVEIPVSTLVEAESDIEATVWSRLAFADNADALVLAYHEGEIWDAVHSLPEDERRYVILRFYRGFTHTESMVYLGRNTKTGSLWCQAKARLQHKLAHLVEA